MKKPLFFLVLIVGMLSSCSNNNADSNTNLVANKEATAQKTSNTTNDPNKVNWLSLEEAQKLNAKAPRKMVIDVYTHWCGPCKMMDRSTFSDPNVVKMLNDEYYAVKFNAESGDPVEFKGKTFANPRFDPNRPKNRRNYPHELTGELGIRGYPTLVVFDEELNKITNIVGYKNPQQLKATLTSL